MTVTEAPLASARVRAMLAEGASLDEISTAHPALAKAATALKAQAAAGELPSAVCPGPSGAGSLAPGWTPITVD